MCEIVKGFAVGFACGIAPKEIFPKHRIYLLRQRVAQKCLTPSEGLKLTVQLCTVRQY